MPQINPENSNPTALSFVSPKLTYEEFLREYDGRYAEFVNGEVILPMTVTKTHNELTRFLSSILQFYIETHKLGSVYSEPYQMKMVLDGETRGREPDIFFVETENLDRVKEQFFDGAADLVIEIVSPESVVRDTQDKFEEYQAAGVKEYWLIDPNRRTANFYGYDESGKYRLLPIENEKFTSLVIKDFWIKTEWLWRENLPDLITILKELKII